MLHTKVHPLGTQCLHEPCYQGLCLHCQNADGITAIESATACRDSGTIVFAYIASTLLVVLWLTYTIQVTLQENREDADGVAEPQS